MASVLALDTDSESDEAAPPVTQPRSAGAGALANGAEVHRLTPAQPIGQTPASAAKAAAIRRAPAFQPVGGAASPRWPDPRTACGAGGCERCADGGRSSVGAGGGGVGGSCGGSDGGGCPAGGPALMVSAARPSAEWTQLEEDRLRDLVVSKGTGKWDNIAKWFGPSRTAEELRQQWGVMRARTDKPPALAQASGVAPAVEPALAPGTPTPATNGGAATVPSVDPVTTPIADTAPIAAPVTAPIAAPAHIAPPAPAPIAAPASMVPPARALIATPPTTPIPAPSPACATSGTHSVIGPSPGAVEADRSLSAVLGCGASASLGVGASAAAPETPFISWQGTQCGERGSGGKRGEAQAQRAEAVVAEPAPVPRPPELPQQAPSQPQVPPPELQQQAPPVPPQPPQPQRHAHEPAQAPLLAEDETPPQAEQITSPRAERETPVALENITPVPAAEEWLVPAEMETSLPAGNRPPPPVLPPPQLPQQPPQPQVPPPELPQQAPPQAQLHAVEPVQSMWLAEQETLRQAETNTPPQADTTTPPAAEKESPVPAEREAVPALPPSEETAPLPSSASPAAAACPRKRELFSASSRRSAANESPVHEAPASGLTPPAASPREREPLHARDLRHKLQQGAQRDATTLHSPAGGGGKGAMPPPTASAGGFGRGGGAPSPGLLEATQPEWPVSAGGGEGAGRKGDAEEGGGGGVAGDGALGYCASAAEDGGPAGSGGSGHGVDVHTESAEGASGVSATQIFVTKLPAGIDTGWVQRMFQRFGEIADCNKPFGKYYAFVRFHEPSSARAALAAHSTPVGPRYRWPNNSKGKMVAAPDFIAEPAALRGGTAAREAIPPESAAGCSPESGGSAPSPWGRGKGGGAGVGSPAAGSREATPGAGVSSLSCHALPPVTSSAQDSTAAQNRPAAEGRAVADGRRGREAHRRGEREEGGSGRSADRHLDRGADRSRSRRDDVTVGRRSSRSLSGETQRRSDGTRGRDDTRRDEFGRDESRRDESRREGPRGRDEGGRREGARGREGLPRREDERRREDRRDDKRRRDESPRRGSPARHRSPERRGSPARPVSATQRASPPRASRPPSASAVSALPGQGAVDLTHSHLAAPVRTFSQLMLPQRQVGRIIGARGCHRRGIEGASGASVLIQGQPADPDQEQWVRIEGEPEQVAVAEHMILDLLRTGVLTTGTAAPGSEGGGEAAGMAAARAAGAAAGAAFAAGAVTAGSVGASRAGVGATVSVRGAAASTARQDGGRDASRERAALQPTPPPVPDLPSQTPAEVMVELFYPQNQIGKIIGTCGSVKARIERASGASLQVQDRPANPDQWQCVQFWGLPQDVEAAKKMVAGTVRPGPLKSTHGGAGTSALGSGQGGAAAAGAAAAAGCAGGAAPASSGAAPCASYTAVAVPGGGATAAPARSFTGGTGASRNGAVAASTDGGVGDNGWSGDAPRRLESDQRGTAVRGVSPPRATLHPSPAPVPDPSHTSDPPRPAPEPVVVQVHYPQNQIRQIVRAGVKGAIERASGAYLHVQKKPSGATQWQWVRYRGPPEAVQEAKQMVDAMLRTERLSITHAATAGTSALGSPAVPAAGAASAGACDVGEAASPVSKMSYSPEAQSAEERRNQYLRRLSAIPFFRCPSCPSLFRDWPQLRSHMAVGHDIVLGAHAQSDPKYKVSEQARVAIQTALEDKYRDVFHLLLQASPEAGGEPAAGEGIASEGAAGEGAARRSPGTGALDALAPAWHAAGGGSVSSCWAGPSPDAPLALDAAEAMAADGASAGERAAAAGVSVEAAWPAAAIPVSAAPAPVRAAPDPVLPAPVLMSASIAAPLPVSATPVPVSAAPSARTVPAELLEHVSKGVACCRAALGGQGLLGDGGQVAQGGGGQGAPRSGAHAAPGGGEGQVTQGGGVSLAPGVGGQLANASAGPTDEEGEADEAKRMRIDSFGWTPGAAGRIPRGGGSGCGGCNGGGSGGSGSLGGGWGGRSGSGGFSGSNGGRGGSGNGNGGSGGGDGGSGGWGGGNGVHPRNMAAAPPVPGWLSDWTAGPAQIKSPTPGSREHFAHQILAVLLSSTDAVHTAGSVHSTGSVHTIASGGFHPIHSARASFAHPATGTGGHAWAGAAGGAAGQAVYSASPASVFPSSVPSGGVTSDSATPASVAPGGVALPCTFRSAQEYVQWWRPLLILELVASLCDGDNRGITNGSSLPPQQLTRPATRVQVSSPGPAAGAGAAAGYPAPVSASGGVIECVEAVFTVNSAACLFGECDMLFLEPISARDGRPPAPLVGVVWRRDARSPTDGSRGKLLTLYLWCIDADVLPPSARRNLTGNAAGRAHGSRADPFGGTGGASISARSVSPVPTASESDVPSTSEIPDGEMQIDDAGGEGAARDAAGGGRVGAHRGAGAAPPGGPSRVEPSCAKPSKQRAPTPPPVTLAVAAVRPTKIGAVTSEWREWEALHSLLRFSTSGGPPRGISDGLKRAFLAAEQLPTPGMKRPRPTAPIALSGPRWDKMLRHMERLKAVAQLDEGQERALRQTTELAFTRHEGFVLVQGPPGTGKTTTLLGLLNVLHNGATQDHFQAVLDRTKATAGPAASAAAAAAAAASAGGAATHAPHSIDALSAAVAGLTGAYASAPSNAAGGPLLAAPPRGGRILVCAHSNCAIDELVTRILQRKPPFIDEYGNPYAPSIARVGSRGADVLCSLDKRVADREAAVRHAIQAAGGEAQLRRNTTVLLHSLTQEVARHAAHCAFIHEHAAHAALAPTAATCATCGWAAAGASLPHSEFALCFASSLEGQIIHLTEAAQEQHALIRAIGCLPAASRRDDDRAAMRQLRALVLDECHIVFCTMSAAAESLVSEVDGGFEVVLLDEAAQASELASLVPMAHGARLVGLVGDPMQLPATVLSHRARELGFGRSLFERLQRAGHPVLMLQTQYRMHGAIRAFPSVHFYGSQLKDSESIARMMSRPPGAPGGPPALFKPMRSHSTVRSHSSRRRPDLRCAPYAFFNLQNGAQERGGEGLETSLLNRGEAALCVALIFALRRAARAAAPAATSSAQPGVPSAEPGEPCKHRGKEAANGGSQCKWGSLCGRMVVLTPYNAQRDEIRRLLNLLGRGIGLPADGVEVSSVDAYQGREADVVIFSCVRAGSGPLGFVKDARRLNVALTRARHALYIIGSEEALRRGSPDWHALLDDARRRALCCEVEASSLRQVLRQADEAGYRKLGDYLMHLLPYTLLDGCRDGLRAPSPPDGMLVELLPQPGRPEGGQPVIPRWLG